jgi:hypothetical protein
MNPLGSEFRALVVVQCRERQCRAFMLHGLLQGDWLAIGRKTGISHCSGRIEDFWIDLEVELALPHDGKNLKLQSPASLLEPS